MLQLIRLKEEKQEGNSKDKISFTLTFSDDELIEETWSLLKKCIENYRLHEENGFNNETRIETKVTILEDKYIKLRVIYPDSPLKVSNQEIEDDLERYKRDFENYYQKLVGKIKLIPVYRI